jgi:O-acetyl-ADP-ribose deacetylase (regulator of RNase III)
VGPAMARDEARTCFVVMPFGVKKDAEGQEIDFDRVYSELIEPSIEGMGLEAIRSDDIMRAGSIHFDMLRHIASDAVALVDITLMNPNVFYELGVRHALRPYVTVLIKRCGSNIPFNIQGERTIEYPPAGGSYVDAIRSIREFVAAGLDSVRPDSPIFSFLQDARKDWKTERITRLEEYRFRLVSRPGIGISVVTGDIRGRQGIDVWVSSENTNMQMSRFYDRSLSATIRYEGARKDENGDVAEDTIAEELARVMGAKTSVAPGTVYVTGSGALADSHGVKRIFHAASVVGVPGSGYQAMHEVEKCVTNALRRMDDKRYAAEDLRSIVFPMLGTGAGGGSVDTVAPRLIEAAIGYLSETPGTHVQKVCFSAWNHRDVEACLAALKSCADVEREG